MTDQPTGEVTELLARWKGGDQGALDELMPIVYKELRKLAQSYFRTERSDHTLQATALVNEAFLRLVKNQGPIHDRSHFFALAARAMRQILVDYARQRRTSKRGGAEVHTTLDEAKGRGGPDTDSVDLLALDIALRQLADIDDRQARVVELRHFGGLSIQETAEVLETSPATVKRDWDMARAWLRRQLMRIT